MNGLTIDLIKRLDFVILYHTALFLLMEYMNEYVKLKGMYKRIPYIATFLQWLYDKCKETVDQDCIDEYIDHIYKIYTPSNAPIVRSYIKGFCLYLIEHSYIKPVVFNPVCTVERKGTKRKHEIIYDYYRFLGIEPDADENTIKKAYRTLAIKFHPDICNDEKSHFIMIALNRIYETLKDRNRRYEYDISLGFRTLTLRECLESDITIRTKSYYKIVI